MDKRLIVLVDEDLHKDIKALAKLNYETTSGYIRSLLIGAVANDIKKIMEFQETQEKKKVK